MAATPYDKQSLVPRDEHREPTQQVQNGEIPVLKPNTKSLALAYVLWFPLGLLGLHRMYLGHWFMGIVYLFTLGNFGIGWLADCFLLPYIVREHNIQATYDSAHPEELKRPAGKYCTLQYRNQCDAYILTLSPLGLLGVQHGYLGRHWYRLAYVFSIGLCGIGWFTDIFRMPSLVKKTNEEVGCLRRGMTLTELKHSDVTDCNTVQAYLFAIPGFFGFHHFYLGRWKIGFTYFFTLGLCGIGWLVDLLRMPDLVERSNIERKKDTQNTKHLDDAYLMAFPLGILGFHHFYLNRPGWGILYFFTAGLFGIGWLIDLARLPSLVHEANLRNKQNVTIIPANVHHPAYVVPADVNAYVITPSGSHTYPANSVYPNLPTQNGQYPNAPPYPQNVPYQSTEYPPTYVQAVSNEERSQHQAQPLKQYPPP